MKQSSRRLKAFLRYAGVGFAVLLVVLGFLVAWLAHRFRASLPQLDGTRRLAGISHGVRIDRDQQGIPSIHAANMDDAYFGIGWVHAQERYFQMDLLRRRAAGRLAELFGPGLVAADRNARIHGFEEVARQAVVALTDRERRMLTMYVSGVNAGLQSLAEPPPEYLVLGVTPAPWRAEDTLLVVHALWFDLQDSKGRYEQTLDVVKDTLGQWALDFFAPRMTQLDSPLQGRLPPPLTVPSPEKMNFNKTRCSSPEEISPLVIAADAATAIGSNSFAVTGDLTERPSAMLANDLHLSLSLPNVWYRICIFLGPEFKAAGATVPGLPGVVIGSNGSIAWGLTNSRADCTDLVRVAPVPGHPDSYQTQAGQTPFTVHQEIINVRKQKSVPFTYRTTIWGPIVRDLPEGQAYAMRWVPHVPAATNLILFSLVDAKSADDAVKIAHAARMPPLHLLVGDNQGRVAWTIAGSLPRRSGADGELPEPSATATPGTLMLRPGNDIPSLRYESNGRAYTANNRVLGGPGSQVLGYGQYDLGARASQIRLRLHSLPLPLTERNLLGIDLDHEALLMVRWRNLFRDSIKRRPDQSDGPHRAVLQILGEPRLYASVDSVAYRLTREFRLKLAGRILQPLFSRCRHRDRTFDFNLLPWEDAVWVLLQQRPLHFLDLRYKDWDQMIDLAIDDVIAAAGKENASLTDYSWGRRNVIHFRHPFSQLMPPIFSRLLDLPSASLPGDVDMPRMQTLAVGSTIRMVVSPGFEATGILHMPGGQSGHPLSPYYASGHDDWLSGRASPFLPGKAVHHLALLPLDH